MTESPKKKSPRFKHAPHAAWRRVEDEAIILDLNSSVYYSLNDSGALIWERLGEGTTPDGIADELSDEFAVKPDAAARDIALLVERLLKERLLIPA